jgi:hypothetical protein
VLLEVALGLAVSVKTLVWLALGEGLALGEPVGLALGLLVGVRLEVAVGDTLRVALLVWVPDTV